MHQQKYKMYNVTLPLVMTAQLSGIYSEVILQGFLLSQEDSEAWCLSWQSNIYKATGLMPTTALCLIKVSPSRTWTEALLAHISPVTLVKCFSWDVNGLQSVPVRGRNVAHCYWLCRSTTKNKKVFVPRRLCQHKSLSLFEVGFGILVDLDAWHCGWVCVSGLWSFN